jgi:hypothetical protein
VTDGTGIRLTTAGTTTAGTVTAGTPGNQPVLVDVDDPLAFENVPIMPPG